MATFRERFPRLTKGVDNIGIWWAVFGPGGVLAVIMTWAASAVSPISSLGWGAVILAGVAAACVVMIATSALLVGWRLFNPLPPQPPVAPVVAAAHSARTAGAEEIEKNQANDRVRILNRALYVLVTLEIERLGRGLVERLIEDSPMIEAGDISLNTELMKKRTALIDNHIRKVKANLGNTRWWDDLNFQIQDAEAEETNRLKDEGRELPAGGNAFVFRDYAIALAKNRRVIACLEKIKAESKGEELSYMSRIREQFALLDPRRFGL